MKLNNQLQIAIIILLLSSCGPATQNPLVKEMQSYEYSFKPRLIQDWENSRWRTYEPRKEYVKYDRKGNEIEVGDYGERWGYTKKGKPDRTGAVIITNYSGTYPKKLNKVSYMNYNKNNQLLKEEVWLFKDNEKDKLYLQTTNTYKEGKLSKMVQKKWGKLILEEEYDITNVVQDENQTKTSNKPAARSFGDDSVDSIFYNTRGQVIEEIRYRHRDGKITNRKEFIYNRKNLLKRIDNYGINYNDVEVEEKRGYTKFKYKLY